jgi:hypothetical protein
VFLKLHKPAIPVRPVVNNTNFPTHKAAKKLNTILNGHLYLNNQYNTINSNVLDEALSKLRIGHQHRLLTLDIKDLFVNIPTREALVLTSTRLVLYNDRETTQQIVMLLNAILQQNYFIFMGQFFHPDKGVAMGSPISGTMAEIFLQQLESTIIRHLLDDKIICFYTRYVDDILLLYDKTHTNPDIITEYVNTIHNNIQLNPSTVVNNTVNFLDISITRNPPNLKTGIYRKLTTTDTTISFLSNHPREHKMASSSS